MAKKYTDEQISKIIEQYNNTDYKLDYILQEWNMSKKTLIRIIDKHGIKRRKRGRNKGYFGPESHLWSGNSFIHKGYRMIYLFPNDPYYDIRESKNHPYAKEHRVIMCRFLGRILEKNETVHHINGDKLDNRIENLQLRKGHHGQGQKYLCNDCGSINVITTYI